MDGKYEIYVVDETKICRANEIIIRPIFLLIFSGSFSKTLTRAYWPSEQVNE